MKHGRLYTTLVAIIALLFVQIQSRGQTPAAGIDRNKIVIGEQIQLVLAVENAGSLTSWFQLPDSINHFEIVERQKIDTIKIGNIVNYSQVIIITSFDSGRWQIPALNLNGVARTTQPITIDVLPVDVSQMQDYHDIKDIIEVQVETSWIIIAALALLTLISLVIIYWLYKRKKPQTIAAPLLKGKQTPLEWAIDELNKLQQQQLYLNNQVKQHYSHLTDIARSFFVMELKHTSRHQTTEEMMMQLQPVAVSSEVKTTFFQFLRMADSVKFAKYIPAVQESERAIDVIKQMITNVAAGNVHAAYQPNKN